MKSLWCLLGFHSWRYCDSPGTYGQEDTIRDCRRPNCDAHEECFVDGKWWGLKIPR